MSIQIRFPSRSNGQAVAKKKYQTPFLQEFGGISDLTQAGSANAKSDGTPDCAPGKGDMGKMCVF